VSEPTVLSVAAQDSGRRLDQFLAGREGVLSRTRAQDLILTGNVRLNGAIVRPSYRVQAGDQIRLSLPEVTPAALAPEAIAFDVLYEDADMLVLDKPAGLAVHPAPGHEAHTLVHGLLARYPNLPGIGGERRPGIVHRLDLETSGLLMVAKTERGLAALSAQLQRRTVKKGYWALVKGAPADREGVIDAPIARDPVHRQRMAVVAGGRAARTHYVCLAALDGFTLVLAMPETGRTHQIRVHFAAIGHPIAGDPVYGGRADFLDRQFLHAGLLRFARPADAEMIELSAPLPADLRGALALLFRNAGTPAGEVEPSIDRMLRLGKEQFRHLSSATEQTARAAKGRA
jgi:23S rRNA pseudouridine1911/1915/1917 synthase